MNIHGGTVYPKWWVTVWGLTPGKMYIQFRIIFQCIIQLIANLGGYHYFWINPQWGPVTPKKVFRLHNSMQIRQRPQ